MLCLTFVGFVSHEAHIGSEGDRDRERKRQIAARNAKRNYLQKMKQIKQAKVSSDVPPRERDKAKAALPCTLHSPLPRSIDSLSLCL